MQKELLSTHYVFNIAKLQFLHVSESPAFESWNSNASFQNVCNFMNFLDVES